jgi:hypothetical protein
MKTCASSRDIDSPRIDESELSSPSLSISSKWRDPDTESKSGLSGWNATDPTVSAIDLYNLIIQNEVSHTIMRVIFQRGGGPIERSCFGSDFVCWLCTEAEYIGVTVLGISTKVGPW